MTYDQLFIQGERLIEMLSVREEDGVDEYLEVLENYNEG